MPSDTSDDEHVNSGPSVAGNNAPLSDGGLDIDENDVPGLVLGPELPSASVR